MLDLVCSSPKNWMMDVGGNDAGSHGNDNEKNKNGKQCGCHGSKDNGPTPDDSEDQLQ